MARVSTHQRDTNKQRLSFKIYTSTMIITLEADSIRWHADDLCVEHHEHG